MQSLLAEIVKLNFPREVLANEILNMLAYWWLEVVLVDFIEVLDFVEIDFSRASKESRNVFLEDSQSGVHILEDSDD